MSDVGRGVCMRCEEGGLHGFEEGGLHGCEEGGLHGCNALCCSNVPAPYRTKFSFLSWIIIIIIIMDGGVACNARPG